MKLKNFTAGCAVFAMAAACAVAMFAQDEAPGDVQESGVPRYYSKIAQRVGNLLERRHVLQHPLDDEISRKAWTNLVEAYDYNHSIFLQSDIESFRDMEEGIDDAVKAGDISFGWRVREVFKERLAECIAFATNLLETEEFDFTVKEEYRWKRREAPWPADEAEREELWRKRIKNELLAQTLVRELDEEERARRRKAEPQKDTEEEGETEEEAVAAPKLTPKENLVKRYRQYLAVTTEEDDDENTLQRFLGAVTQAYDPHTDYLSPTTKEDFDMDMNLVLCGVGATLSMDEGALKIVDVLPGGPLDRDGRIKKGDKIVAVGQGDGPMEDILYKPMKKSIKKIRGEKGTEVVLEIIPRTDSSGATRKRYKIVRDEIKLEEQAATGRVERVTLGGVDYKFGYVRLPAFYGTMDKKPSDPDYRSSSLDVARYVAKFNAQETDGMVLDLRGNGGGSLMEAVLLTALFEPPAPVVQIREAHRIYALPIPPDEPSFAYKKPLVVLIDRASASASEIVATALQDTGRAIVVGDAQSHGKGTVQTVMPVKAGHEKYGSMKITTARFYRITGSSTQVRGVESDIHIPSILDGLDIGEDKLPNALPWSRIEPVPFHRVWHLNRYVQELVARREKRVEGDEKAAMRERLAKHFAETSRDEYVPLDRERRIAQMREERTMRREADPATYDEIFGEDEEEELTPRERRARAAKFDDPVLKESFAILADLAELTEHAEAPAPRKAEVPTWMQGLFF